MIKAIIFDFGRVISAQKPPSLFRRYEEELGLPPGKLNRIMFGSDIWHEVLVGRSTIDDYWREIGPALGLDSDRAIQDFRRRYHEDESINEAVLELMHGLKGDYRLSVLSNAPAGLSRWLADWQILDLFDDIVCSGEVGLAKPDPAIFRLALERLSVESAEAVFIDDTLGHVEVARSLGMQGIHFTTAEGLEEELERVLADR
jgi:putative hydrolase of the HAD superfamily